uniref:Dimer_Tnp_hAT domain-containing protein n=1 Tax=Caenorhabditis tropicalis TaxID=1561998 RepID=A0A1I7T7B0_9PELO
MFITCFRRSETLRIEGRIPLPFAITRWGGCVMLSISFLNHYQSITALQKSQKFLLTDNEKADLESFVSVTTPFLEGIQQAEKDSTFSSEILVQFASLFEFIREQNQRKNVVRTLKRETEKRFRDYLSNDFLLLSVYVDPRFTYLSGILLDIEWEEVERLVEGYCDTSTIVTVNQVSEPAAKRTKASQSLFSKFVESKRLSTSSESTRSELVNYEGLVMSGRPPLDSCPLSFWRCNSVRFPKLSRLANHVLSSPQSSAQVERLFRFSFLLHTVTIGFSCSRCGELVSSSRRNRMSSQTMNDIILNAALGEMKRNENRANSADSESSEESENDDDYHQSERMNESNSSSRPRSISAPTTFE